MIYHLKVIFCQVNTFYFIQGAKKLQDKEMEKVSWSYSQKNYSYSQKTEFSLVVLHRITFCNSNY